MIKPGEIKLSTPKQSPTSDTNAANRQRDVDILIGLNVYSEFMTGGMKHTHNGRAAVETTFG